MPSFSALSALSPRKARFSSLWIGSRSAHDAVQAVPASSTLKLEVFSSHRTCKQLDGCVASGSARDCRSPHSTLQRRLRRLVQQPDTRQHVGG